MRPMPPFTQALIIVNVLVYFLQTQGANMLFDWFALWPGAGTGWGSLPIFAPWQLLSYSFLHGSVMHIAFNMFALWMFGSDLERVWGPRRIALAYFGSVVSGAVAHLLVGGAFGAAPGPVVGASAGVFGILLAYALVFPDRKIVPLIPPIPIPARWFVAIYAGLELFLGVTGTQQGVAHFAHLGGLLGGWWMYRFGRSGPGNWWRGR